MSPSLPGKFRNRLVNSRLTGRFSNRTKVSKWEESQEKECRESYENTAHPRKWAKFPSPTASNDLSRSVAECRSPCPPANRPGHRDIARRPGPAITRVASGGDAVRRASCKSGEDFLDRLELVSIGRGRHQDRRRDAGVAPRRDTLAHPRGRAEQRRIREPAVAHQAWDVGLAVLRDGGFDRRHLLDIAGLLPVIAVV